MSEDIPHWAKVRAYNLAYGDQERFDTPSAWMVTRTARAFARYIAQHEPEPVDPDLELAREAVAAEWSAQGCDSEAAATLQGQYDGGVAVKSVARAIKLLRERGQ